MEHMGQKNQNTSPAHQIHSPKIMHTDGEGLYQIKVTIVKFEILDFWHFFPFSLTWDHIRVKDSNDISSERTPDLLPKNHGYSSGGSPPRLLKE